MSAEEPTNGYVIGIKEVYTELKEISSKLAALAENVNLRVAGLEFKQQEAEKKLTEIQADMEQAHRDRINTNRQFILALVTSLVLPVLVGLLVWYMTK